LDRRDIFLGATGNDRFPRPGTFGAGTYEWQQRGQFTDTGAFVSADATYKEKLNVILSGRMDNYDATVNGTFAVPTPLLKAKQSDTAETYNVSVSYKVTPGITPYITHAKSSFVELGQGGMIAYDNVKSDAIIQESTLNEAGVKVTGFEKKLFATLAYYEQKKTGYDTNANLGTFNTYRSKGAEFELRFAPTKEWSFTSAVTIQETKVENAPFLLGIPPSYLGLNPALNYGGRYFGPGGSGPGVGLPGNLTVPIPPQVYSFGATYTNPSGWGVSISETYVAEMYSGYLKQIKLPSYFLTNAAVFYNYKQWSFRANVKNLFNEQYFTPQALFEETFISPSQGPTAELTIAYKF
jgi:iron complex outermembrane receptor protein